MIIPFLGSYSLDTILVIPHSLCLDNHIVRNYVMLGCLHNHIPLHFAQGYVKTHVKILLLMKFVFNRIRHQEVNMTTSGGEA